MFLALPSPDTFNGLDWFFVAVMASSALSALLRGAIRVLFSLCGLLAGVWVAGSYYGVLATRLLRLVPDLAVAEAVSYFLLTAAVMVTFSLVAGLLRRTVHAVGLGLADRLLGAALGLLRGALLGSVVLLTLLAFVPNANFLRNSVLAPYFLAGAHAVSSIVPRNLRNRLPAGVQHLLPTTAEAREVRRQGVAVPCKQVTLES